MSTRIWIDGVVHDEHSARVSVFDRGFLYGDSVYEVVRTSGGAPVDLTAHLDRLERSGARLMLPIPPRASLENAVNESLRAADNPESYIRIVITRGSGDIGLDPALAVDPLAVVIVKPLSLPPAEHYEHGCALRIVHVERTARAALDPAVKSGNYLNNILALQEARRAGAHEAILCDPRGRIAEGSTCNVFAVRGETLVTPALEVGLLEGITRMRILSIARADSIRVVEGELWPDELRNADEIFVTSSIRGVLPAGRIDDRPIPVGPVTRRLMALYDEYVRSQPR
jgi:branched-chain amino acid aminotransferase